jgi:hypothetical protein
MRLHSFSIHILSRSWLPFPPLQLMLSPIPVYVLLSCPTPFLRSRSGTSIFPSSYRLFVYFLLLLYFSPVCFALHIVCARVSFPPDFSCTSDSLSVPPLPSHEHGGDFFLRLFRRQHPFAPMALLTSSPLPLFFSMDRSVNPSSLSSFLTHSPSLNICTIMHNANLKKLFNVQRFFILFFAFSIMTWDTIW